MKKLVLLVTILLLLAVIVQRSTPTIPEPMVWPDRGSRLTVETYNIKTIFSTRILDTWFLRKPLVIHEIREEVADIVAVQEAYTLQIDDIVSSLPGYTAVTTVGSDQRQGYPTILYRKERFEQIATDRLFFSVAPQIPRSVSWGNEEPRCFTTARFRDKFTGQVFAVASVHLDHRSSNSRNESVKLLAAWVLEQTVPVIVAGDFNEPARSGVLNPLRTIEPQSYQATHLLDSHLIAGAQDEGTLHGFTGRAVDRIDMILVTGDWTVVDSHISKYHRGRRYPSDHFPVTATLDFPVRLIEIQVAGIQPAYY